MSEFHEVELIFQNKQTLIEALEQSGYSVEVHDQCSTVDDYYGKKKLPAHLIVRRDQFNGTRDIGFEKRGEIYIMHADNMDYSQNRGRFNLSEVNKKYCEIEVKRLTSSTTRYNILKQYEDEEGDTKIEIRVMN